MISITVSVGDESSTIEFPKTAKGNKESIKYIQALHTLRKNDPWYYLLDKIEPKEREMKDKGFRYNRTKKEQLERTINDLWKEREEYLDMQGITEAPPVIKLEIINT
jgi:hypothetical protein